MNAKLLLLRLLTTCWLGTATLVVASLGTTITYQGRLADAGAPATGNYDLRFILYNAEIGGSQVGELLTRPGVVLEAGVFTVPLDFGTGVFDGAARWIEVAVRKAGVGNFAILTPRQAVTSVPYAQFALTPAGPQGPKGDTGGLGPQGPQGLKGEKGDTGTAGVAGLQGSKGDKGDPGLTGSAGPQGPSGAAGKTVLNGNGEPGLEFGTTEDFYLDTTANRLFGPKTANGWGAGVALVGPAGPQGAIGPQGPAGAVGPQGSTGSAGAQGIQGLIGPQGDKGDPGVTGAAGPQGPSGQAGKSVLNGSGAPAVGSGTADDFYLDTAVNRLYGPKTADGWGAGVALVGPAGPAGPQGATGAIGPQGVVGSQGPTGATGATGLTGPQGPAGPQGSPGSADAWSRSGNAGTTAGVNFLGTTDNQPLQIRVNNSPAIQVQSDGRVGVGTTTMAANSQLTVNGTIASSDVPSPMFFVYPSGTSNPEKPLIVHSPSFPGYGLYYRDAGDRFVMKSSPEDTSPSLVVDLDGNWVAIATDTPKPGYELSVRGEIVCHDLLIQNSSLWPDYVFEPGYALKSLDEVEAYIRANKHLPSLPAAAEIEADGVSVGDMQKLMMEKIEELTLYVIDQNKRLATQERQISELRQVIESRQAAIGGGR